jgi:TrmH family RNA methyltransferase
VLTITSPANPRIKDIRALAIPIYRRESGLFLAEGLKLVTDALSEHWPIETLIHSEEAGQQAATQRAAATARARGADIIVASAAVLEKVSRRENPQTVLGVFRQRFLSAAEIKPGNGVWIALEAARDPGNVGTIIRTADAVGGDGIILIGPSVDPYSTEAVRATMGSIFHVPLARLSEPEFLEFRRSWPGRVIGTHLAGTADYGDGDYGAPVLLVMGNEQSGLSPTIAGTCDQLVRIPMAGRADSLNLAVATAVMLYEIRRAALAAGSRGE